MFRALYVKIVQVQLQIGVIFQSVSRLIFNRRIKKKCAGSHHFQKTGEQPLFMK